MADTNTIDLATFKDGVVLDEGEQAPEAETPEVESEEPETGENGTGEGEGEGGEPKPKGKSVQDRFDEMTAARREAEREAEYWRTKALAREEPVKEKEEAKPDPEPNPADYDLGDLDPKYNRDVARWDARQEFRQVLEREREEAQTAEARREFQRLAATYEERVSAAAEKYPDFEEVVTRSAKAGKWPCTEMMRAGILESEAGVDLAYHFATHPDEAIRISRMDDYDQARAIGRLEARYLDAPQPQVSRAPAPPKAQARGSGGQFVTDGKALYRKMLSEFR